MDYDPCDDCRKQWTLGIVVAEAQTTPVRERQPPIGSSANPPAYPTGRWCVIRRESFYKVLNPDSPTYAAAMANGTVVCTKEVFDHLCPPKLIRDAADAALARMDVQGNA